MAKGLNRGRANSRVREKSNAKSNTKTIGWSVRQFREDSPTGPVLVEFTFPTSDHAVSHLCVLHSELRHRRLLLDKFADRVPRFPAKVGGGDEARFDFIRGIVRRASGSIDFVPRKPGFIDKHSFATFDEILHSDGTRRKTPPGQLPSDQSRPDIGGTLTGSTERVLKTAKRSTFLAFGIAVALASPLLTYLRLYASNDATLTETAIFNFSGHSSAGKSSVGLAAQSLVGNPQRAGAMNFSERGLAEYAAANNDLVTVLDDTEKNVNDITLLIRGIVHGLSSGRSKMISEGANRFPPLRFSTLSLASSPRPIPMLAAEAGHQMTRGELVRLFDIPVPPPQAGGIFDRVRGTKAKRAKKSIKLIKRLEAGYQNHYGHVFPSWILWLLKKDRSPQIVQAVDRFITHVGADRDGWDKRFARKFGLAFAAMEQCVRAGILPWPRKLPLSVATKCYRLARQNAFTDVGVAQSYARQLAKRLSKPGRTIDHHRRAATAPVIINERCIALRYQKDGRLTFGVFDDALLSVVKTKSAKQLLTTILTERGIIAKGHGHAGTVQEHLPIKRGGKRIARPHVWAVDARRLAKFIERASG